MPRMCKCGNGMADIKLEYYKPTRRGESCVVTVPMDMRCADKTAMAVMSRGARSVKARRVA